MKLRKKIAILAIIGATGLFAIGMSDVSTLVDKINHTNDLKTRSQLIEKLNADILSMDKKELPEAQKFVNANLKKVKIAKK